MQGARKLSRHSNSWLYWVISVEKFSGNSARKARALCMAAFQRLSAAISEQYADTKISISVCGGLAWVWKPVT